MNTIFLPSIPKFFFSIGPVFHLSIMLFHRSGLELWLQGWHAWAEINQSLYSCLWSQYWLKSVHVTQAGPIAANLRILLESIAQRNYVGAAGNHLGTSRWWSRNCRKQSRKTDSNKIGSSFDIVKPLGQIQPEISPISALFSYMSQNSSFIFKLFRVMFIFIWNCKCPHQYTVMTCAT